MSILSGLRDNIAYLEANLSQLSEPELVALAKARAYRQLSLSDITALTEIRKRYDHVYRLQKGLDALDQKANEILTKSYCKENAIGECMVLDLTRTGIIFKDALEKKD